MRRLVLALLAPGLIVVGLAQYARAEETFPYQAYVTADNVYVRCGPGQDYYPTDKLPAGTVVEIYRHDPGGWCAIRPPKGSFTWVSRRYLKPAGDGLAEVTGAKVAARVGSRFSPIRDVVQVRLNQGEVVELVEPNREPTFGDNSEDVWVKIAPPSGEFRWIHSRHVDPNYPADGIRKAPAEESPLYQASRPNRFDTTADRFGKTSVSREAGRPVRNGNGPVALPTEAVPPSSEAFQRRLEDAELALATMVAEEPTVWKFDELAPRAESLLAEAETAVERGRVRILLDKLDRFADIQKRLDSVDTMLARRERLDRRLSEIESRHGKAGGGDARFDGQGRLTRVVSAKPGAPRYALVDASGKVQCYVTPSQGVNLQHYEQRWVGVNGTRGYMPEQQAQHIMAQHVSVLGDETLRR